MNFEKLDMRRTERRLKDRWFDIVSPEGTFPIRIENRASTSAAIVGVIGAAVCFAAAWMIAYGVGGIEFGSYGILERTAPVLVALMGAWLLVKAILAQLSRGHIEITRDEVRVLEPGLFKKKSWSEPLTSFSGVRWSTRILNRRNNSGGNRELLHVIDLAHPDDRVFVPLDKWITDGDDPRQTWERLAAALDMPAIDAREGAVHVRAPGDVDKTIKELAHEGKVSTNWTDREPPEGITIHRDGRGEQGHAIWLEMFERPISPLLAMVISGSLVLIAIYGVLQGQVFIAAICLGLAYLLFRIMRRAGTEPAELTITRQDVSYVTNGVPQAKVALGDVERVKVGSGSVVVETDAGEKVIARNLSPEALDYVRDLVESAIANA